MRKPGGKPAANRAALPKSEAKSKPLRAGWAAAYARADTRLSEEERAWLDLPDDDIDEDEWTL